MLELKIIYERIDMQYISVASGSSGNCHFLQEKNTKILIDAGLSGKSIIDSLAKHDIELNDIKAVFITHEHTDHIKGAGIISRKFDIPIYSTQGTWESMMHKIGNIKEHNIKIIKNMDDVFIGDLKISSIPINHDAADPVAYKITDGKKALSIVTDLGIVTKQLMNFIKECEVIILEANHDINMLDAGPYTYELKRRVKSNFGHLSNDSAGECAASLVKEKAYKIMLAHLSRQNNIPILAYQSVLSILSEHGIKVGCDVELSVLEQFTTSEKVTV